ncbi:hypothetical protein H2200_008766 [Cladophialophora chaetospira]|uniref:O-methyltransferase dimerisation domain-containing protein n=1 Tax=Cladophialophora chaetospira TaxID=386627 RepID=A0AA39CG12_9EURO|nr:hypothetical protein H2200_008766 [Cladophialophora chaetospira]
MPLQLENILSLQDTIQNAFETLVAAAEQGADRATQIKAELRVVNAAQQVEATLLTPTDRVLRLAHLPTVNTATKVAQLLDIFSILQEEMTIEELAESTGADPVLLVRIMRCLTAYNIFAQTRADQFKATHLSRKLAEGPAGSFFKLAYDISHEMHRGIPAALLRTGFKNPRDSLGSGAVKAWGKSIFEHIAEDPTKVAVFGLAMEVHGELEPEYYADFPFSEITEELSKKPNAITIVDVAGGRGHVLRDIIQENPQLPGRFILQDLHEVVQEVQKQDTPFEAMVQDIFQPQTLKGEQISFIVLIEGLAL